MTTAAELVYQVGSELSVAAQHLSVLRYKPHAKQTVFHKAEEMIRLYIGGNRSGKTVGGVMEGIYFLKGEHPFKSLPMRQYEPCRGRVIGVDFDNGVKKILLPQYSAAIPKSLLINGSWEDSYNGSEKKLTLRDKSFVEFMSYDQDLDKFAGTSRHFVHMDEEPPKPIYTENVARVIDANGCIWITMTPVEGMTWVYDTLYEPGILGTNPDVKVIVVDLTENPHVTEEQRRKFINTLDEEDLSARIHGRFVQMGGLIYKKFDPVPGGTHVIDRTLRPPKDWEVIMGLDHGLNNPTAVGWHMISPDGDMITYAEHYKSGWVIKQHAEHIKKEWMRQGRVPNVNVADPSIWNKDPITGTSIAEEYQKEGIFFVKANNDVKAGIIRVNGLIIPQKMPSGNFRSRWHVTTDCKMHIKEMTRYRWKTYANKKDQYEKNSFEEPHKKDDHAMDQLRYVTMSRPDLVSSVETTPEKDYRDDNGRVAPGVVTHGATASDFYSSDGFDVNDPDINKIPENVKGTGDYEFDEHMGGVW